MNVSIPYDSCAQSYSWKGRQEVLIQDGAVDHQIWDELVLGSSRAERQEFIKSVHDPRLRALHIAQRGSEPLDLGSLLGQNWKDNQKRFVVGDPEGSHQRLEFGPMGRSGSEFKLITVAKNDEVGRMEHTIEASFTFGFVGQENIKEGLKLEG
ncbi:hypothetical protein JST97_02470 [bacterium]|nr:hypothetical protein [bacterium]